VEETGKKRGGKYVRSSIEERCGVGGYGRSVAPVVELMIKRTEREPESVASSRSPALAHEKRDVR
jgi:hypothetical protein